MDKPCFLLRSGALSHSPTDAYIEIITERLGARPVTIPALLDMLKSAADEIHKYDESFEFVELQPDLDIVLSENGQKVLVRGLEQVVQLTL